MPDGTQIPAWVWTAVINTAKGGIFAVGTAVVFIIWRTRRLPFSGQAFKQGRDKDRRIHDDDKIALLQLVRDNTAAMQALRSLGEDSKSVTISAIGKLDEVGKVLAAVVQKLADVHDDVRHRAQPPRQISGG